MSNNTSMISIIPDQFVETAFKADYDLIVSVIFRTVIVTLIVLFIIRWLGNKGLGQLTTFELLIVVGLGSSSR